MQILRHAHEVSAFVQSQSESEIAVLIQRRLDELLSEGDTTMEELVFFVIPGSRDTVADLETAAANSLRHTLDSAARHRGRLGASATNADGPSCESG